MMQNKKLFISIKNRDIRSEDGYRYDLTERFLYLYYYLVLTRIEDPMKSGGFAMPEEILLLPHWQRNNVASVGKQIRRHILKMDKIGRNVIETQQKIYGPFRLVLPAEQVQIDVPITTIMDILDLRHISKLGTNQEGDFYRYVEYVWEGDKSFFDGFLEKALALYRQAAEAAINPGLKVAALQKIGRTLEGLGDLHKAQTICQRILKLKGLTEQEESTTYIIFGLVKYRQRYLDEAEVLYNKALDLVRGKRHHKIMGGIYNGLGLVRKERGEYEEALTFYQRALEYWSLVDYFYGIQAAYFNIGNLYKIWGDQWGEQNKTFRDQNYKKGIEWVKRCISLCEKMKIGYETSQDHILLSALYRRIGDLDSALEYARTANKMALNAGNKKDIAYSYRILGKVYISKGEKEQAKEAFQEYMSYLKKIGLKKKDLREREEEIKNFLDKHLS